MMYFNLIVFYGFGRKLKQECPFPAETPMARDFTHDKLEDFKNQFPNLCLDDPVIANLRIAVGTLKLSPHRFIARNVKTIFLC